MDARGQTFEAAAIAVAVIVLLSGTAVALSYEGVGEGHVGVKKSWGAVTGQTYSPGAHWIMPVQDSVQHVEVRPRTYTMSDSSGEGKKAGKQDAVVVQTVNGTTVRVDVTVRYRVEKENADKFVEQWNTVEQVEHRLIRPTVRSQLRDEAAAIPTSEIYTSAGRERLSDAARAALKAEFEGEATVLEAVQVREVNLPDQYEKALTQKEVAKQQVKKKQHDIEKERKEAKRKRIEAEADADVIRIKGKALENNRVVLTQEYIASIDNSDKVILATNSEGTPIILDAQGNASASG